ncbi:hypothetical protein RRG08_063444 [Elysia crispata]|uniref:Uncharacterized protein n=1 Tax=Elysia crispata TaxID=231223 RepID=A0AAE1AA28_9GAST|nr:hypothetical protein RRG08_063444 [Elysia crispata]
MSHEMAVPDGNRQASGGSLKPPMEGKLQEAEVVESTAAMLVFYALLAGARQPCKGNNLLENLREAIRFLCPLLDFSQVELYSSLTRGSPSHHQQKQTYDSPVTVVEVEAVGGTLHIVRY